MLLYDIYDFSSMIEEKISLTGKTKWIKMYGFNIYLIARILIVYEMFGTCVYRKERSIGTEYETVAALATFDDWRKNIVDRGQWKRNE